MQKPHRLRDQKTYAARDSGSPSPRDCAIPAILCATVRGAGRAGIKRISKTKLNHSSPSATANEIKIAPATATNPIPFSMAKSSL
jgi:hypothetical protein